MFQNFRKRPTEIIWLFASFMLLQFVILRMGNQAGRGFLPDRRQELVYLFLQCAVIPGFLLHAPACRLLKGGRSCGAIITTAAVLCGAGGEMMLFLPGDSLPYLIVTGLTVFLLGFTGGAVYLRLCFLMEDASCAGLSLGLGYAIAVALQFCLQLQWTVKPALAVLLALSCAGIVLPLTREQKTEPTVPSQECRKMPVKELLFASVVTFALLLFSGYYNRYIHHLQVASGYGEYNVYTWPRLLMIPASLLFGGLGDLKNGRYLPISTLCVSALAILNTSLLGRETYLLNMGLYYVSLSAVIMFYHLVFLRLSPRAAHPALWACMGRVLDSACVLLTFLIRLSEQSQATVLLIEIAALTAAIVLMAVGGAFNLSPAGTSEETVPAAPTEPAESTPPAVDPIDALREQYGLTPGELRVFRELVLTEDKQTVIGERLSIKVRTVQANVTAIYRKTGVSTRAGLVQLFRGIGQ